MSAEDEQGGVEHVAVRARRAPHARVPHVAVPAMADALVAVRDPEMAARETAALVASLRFTFPRMPRREMQELVHRGREVVPDLLGVLQAGAAPGPDAGILWATVTLGEIGVSDAIPPLARLLASPVPGVATTAAEALAKCGPPAVPVLATIAATPARDTRRIYAYGALGAIHGDDAHRCLREALAAAPAYADVIAHALALQARPEVVPLLRERGRNAPRWMRREIASAIATLARPARDREPAERDWRLRYRCLPALGWNLPPSWMTVAALRRKRDGTRSVPLTAAAYLRVDPRLHRCRRCGGIIARPTGLPACWHTVRPLAALQASLLQRWRARGFTDAWAALDECDHMDLQRVTARPRRTQASPDAGDRAMVTAALGRATLYWLVAAGHEDLAAAVRYMTFVMRYLDVLYSEAESRSRGVSPPLIYS